MNLPNFVTLIRILLVPVFLISLLSYQRGLETYRYFACGCFFLASVTDMLDGMLARFTRCQTDLGRFLDPLADKLLLLSGYIGILFVPDLPYRPPIWITVVIVFRDLIVVMGLFMIFVASGRLQVEPNLLGKFSTAFQMVTLVMILLCLPLSVLMWNLTAILTIASGFVYIFRDFAKLKL